VTDTTGPEPTPAKIPANRKRCPRCGLVKDRKRSFTHRADGSIFSWCKDCNADYKRDRAAKLRAEKGTILND